jgi:hypothetical protein
MFPGCDNMLFVQKLNQSIKNSSSSQDIADKSNSISINDFMDDGLRKLYGCRPSLKQSIWGCYNTHSLLWSLSECLDINIECERHLKAAIVARYSLEEQQTPFKTDGSPYIGRKVQRKFGRKV